MDGPGDYYNLTSYNTNVNNSNNTYEVQPTLNYAEASAPLPPPYPVYQEPITTSAPSSSYDLVQRPVLNNYSYHPYSRPQPQVPQPQTVSQPQTSQSGLLQTVTTVNAVPDADVTGNGSQRIIEPLPAASISCSASASASTSTSTDSRPAQGNLLNQNIPQVPTVVYDPTGIEIRPTIAFPEVVSHLYINVRSRIVAIGDVLQLIFADLVRLSSIKSAITRHLYVQRIHENVINVRDRLNGIFQVLVAFRRNHSEPFPTG